MFTFGLKLCFTLKGIKSNRKFSYQNSFLVICCVILFIYLFSCNGSLNQIEGGNIFSKVKSEKYNDSIRKIYLDSALYLNQKIHIDSFKIKNYLH